MLALGECVCPGCIVELDKVEILHIGDAPKTRCNNCIIDEQAEVLRTQAYADSKYALWALKLMCLRRGGQKIGNFCLEQGYVAKSYAPYYVATGQVATVHVNGGCIAPPKVLAKHAPMDLIVVKSGQVGGHQTIRKFENIVTLSWHRQMQDAIAELRKKCCEQCGEANAILDLKITKETGEERSNEGWGKHLFAVFRAEGCPAIVQKKATAPKKQLDPMQAAKLLFIEGFLTDEEFKMLKDKIVASNQANK
jgi:hypothetical protein